MRRREFVLGLAALLATRAYAQAPGRLPRVGIYLTSPLESLDKEYVTPFINGMRALGWVEGTTVVYDREFASTTLYSHIEEDNKTINALARTMVDRKPDVIWVAGSQAATAVLDLKSPIPVVGAAVSDVVERKYANSLARPGGNFTGVSNHDPWRLGAKRLEHIHLMMPAMTRAGVLMLRNNPNCEKELEVIRETAVPIRVTVIPAPVDRVDDIPEAIARLAKQRAQAVLIAHHPLFQNYRKLVLDLAAKHRLPAVGHRTFFAREGALMSYSTDLNEQMRQSARMVDKILKGTRPADIPVEQPTKTEFVINLRTAKTLGLTIPHAVLFLANDSIPESTGGGAR